MKKLIIFSALLLVTIVCFSQKQNKKVVKLSSQLDKVYQSEEFLMMDLVIGPEIYNAAGRDIEHIEFFQDSVANKNKSPRIYASINKKRGLDQKYSIGPIFSYQTGKYEVTIIMKVYYADGSIKDEKITTHFDNIYLGAEDIASAEYSIDIQIYDESEEVVLN